MKKLFLALAILIAVALISGYIENNYCHAWTSAETIEDLTWGRHTTGFCSFNAYVSLPGAIFIGIIRK